MSIILKAFDKGVSIWAGASRTRQPLRCLDITTLLAMKRSAEKDPEEASQLVVVGAGPVGCMLTILLSRAFPSSRVIVLEKRPDHRRSRLGVSEINATTQTELRSINLALSHRGRAALRAAGLEEEVLARSVPMRGRAVHSVGAAMAGFQPYDELDREQCIYSVSRRLINDVLLRAAESQPNVVVEFDRSMSRMQRPAHDGGSGGIVISAGTGRPTIVAQAVFGCDGANSAVRESLFHLAPVDFHREHIAHGYVELHVPPHAAALLEASSPREALHIWPRSDGVMLIALPNPDRSYTATLFASFAELRALDDDENRFWDEFMRRYFPDEIVLLDRSHRGRSYPLFTANVSPWIDPLEARVVLMGDAAHTQVPFFGQGMNAGLEDALVFVETLEAAARRLQRPVAPSLLEEVAREFDRVRRPCGVAITRLSQANYEHMHTLSASSWFRAWKRIEGRCARWARALGSSYMPLYYAVAFSRTPYDAVLARELAHERIAPMLGWGGLACAMFGGCVVALVARSARL